ncbi:MAG TPA: hypothetical protein VGU72_20745 [Beijerinckiaceae bacterium]|jgi:hypothetical protein|nr:hypothetical protein [Beijerinckiaceae bacterium]
MQSDIATPILFDRILKTAFWALVAFGASLIWLAHRPPMVDLPQHAGQITLWLDLLKGASPWESLVRVNMLTPYLIGYTAALPFTALFGPLIAVKIILTISYIGWIFACRALRKETGSDPRLEFLFLYSFFGFAWQWGFMTFLVSAPISILFLLFALRYAKEPNMAKGAGLIGLGIILLFSHALLFVFAVGIGGLIVLIEQRRIFNLIAASAPYVILAAVLVVFRFFAHDFNDAVNLDQVASTTSSFGISPQDRWGPAILFTATSALSNLSYLLAIGALLISVLMGGRIQKGAPLVMFAVLIGILGFTPDLLFGTGFVSSRFALFLPIFWALMWKPPQKPSSIAVASTCLLILLCAGILAVRANFILAFAKETASFEKILAVAEPGERAINLTFNRKSDAMNDNNAYLHMSLWYQAEKNGFVDFNFAYFFPQVIRFRKDIGPVVSDSLGFHPEAFNWGDPSTQVYRYAFIRGSRENAAGVAKAPPCGTEVIAQEAEWTLLKRRDCN